jgi:uncharacterized protein (DUF885 family)
VGEASDSARIVNPRALLSVLFLLPLVFVGACGGSPSSTTSATNTPNEAHAAEAHEALNTLFEEHFEAHLRLNPSLAQSIGDYRFNHLMENNLSDEYIRESKELNDAYLEAAENINETLLTPEMALRRAFFIDIRKRHRLAESFPRHLLPINQFYSRANGFAVQGSGQGVHPFQKEKDYRDFIAKAKLFDTWVDTAIFRMKEGIEKKVVLPRILIERVLPQLKAQYAVKKLNESTFYGPLNKLPADIQGPERAALIADYEAAIKDIIMPAYKKLHDFMKAEYLPHGRATHGMKALPNGKAWYQYRIEDHTTTTMSAEEIHQIGVAEVDRIRKEMDQVRKQVAFKGDLSAFFKHLSTDDQFFFESKDELVAGYQALKDKIEAVLPEFFDVTPKTKYEVRPVEAFREKNAAGASYQSGTADGSRPGVFYINTYNLRAQPRWGMETLSLHEAAPGHHFQISIQQEMQDAPKFQRFSDSTAFAEGWALYAESIGKEMGLFTDPYQYFGKLSDELLRAMRLVVDTGLHDKGWTREMAIAYMLDHSAMAKSDVTAEVERYMAIPGQALAYKIGQLKITQLRTMAENALGSEFDIRQFHNQVLLDGSLPMSILEQKIKHWISSQRTQVDRLH